MKKIIAIFLLALMVFSLGACTKSNTPPDDNIVDNDDTIEENPQDTIEEGDKIVEPTPSTDEVEVTLYFANKEYLETGDESLEKLIPEKRMVEYGDVSLEERVVEELMKGPESDELSTVIPSNVKLLGVDVADETAFVNFAREGLYGGSMQEDFTIAQIVDSLIELDSVERVQFLIEGEEAETLMGHMEISEPFEK